MEVGIPAHEVYPCTCVTIHMLCMVKLGCCADISYPLADLVEGTAGIAHAAVVLLVASGRSVGSTGGISGAGGSSTTVAARACSQAMTHAPDHGEMLLHSRQQCHMHQR
eukprot:1161126-Pelagomonas_calceolata.AAC.3